MARMTLHCGRFIPRARGGSEVDVTLRVALLEAYLGRLSEELEMLLGEGGAGAAATATVIEAAPDALDEEATV